MGGGGGGGGGGPLVGCRLKYSYFVSSRLKVSIFVGKSQLISTNACYLLIFAMYFTHFRTLNSIKRVKIVKMHHLIDLKLHIIQ